MNKKLIALFLISLTLTTKILPAAQYRRGWPEGWTELHEAVLKNDREDLMRMLNQSCAGINAQDSFGWTALHYAAQFGYLDCVQKLVNKGAHIFIPTYDGATPEAIAFKHRKNNVLAYLQKERIKRARQRQLADYTKKGNDQKDKKNTSKK